MASPAACVSALTCVALLAGAVQYAAGGPDRTQPPAADRAAVERPATRAELAEQLTRTRNRLQQAERRARILERTLAHDPDAHISMRLAAIAYGQDWRHLRACALSEGYREGERYQARIPRANTAGSGAFGPWQFMPATFASTPFAGMDMSRVDVQAHAAAWMFSRGRAGEWTGRGC